MNGFAWSEQLYCHYLISTLTLRSSIGGKPRSLRIFLTIPSTCFLSVNRFSIFTDSFKILLFLLLIQLWKLITALKRFLWLWFWIIKNYSLQIGDLQIVFRFYTNDILRTNHWWDIIFCWRNFESFIAGFHKYIHEIYFN